MNKKKGLFGQEQYRATNKRGITGVLIWLLDYEKLDVYVASLLAKAYGMEFNG